MSQDHVANVGRVVGKSLRSGVEAKTPGEVWAEGALCCTRVDAECPFDDLIDCENCSPYLAAVYNLGWKDAKKGDV